MSFSFRSRLYIGFVLAILVSAVSGIVSYHTFQRQAQQRQWVKTTHHIIDSAQTLRSLMTDMEVGRRGFRATGQPKFLEPYNAALPHVPPLAEGLKDSLADNPDDQKKAIALQQHVLALMQFWAAQGGERQAPTNETGFSINKDAAKIYTAQDIASITAEEKNQMDQVRTMVSDLVRSQNKLLSVRREEYDTLIRYSTLSATGGSILSELIIIVLSIIVLREFRRRRLTQEQLKKSVMVLEHQAEELRSSEEEQKRALAELEAVNKQLEKFVYTVAHDIKSPLAGISGSLSILETEQAISSNPELAEFVQLSRERVVYLTQMINSILEYSRTSIGNQQIEVVDTRALVQGIINLMMPPQNISISIMGNMPAIKTSRIKIMEVFQNLISNAIKYNNKKKGTIEIGCQEKGDFYEFYVKDNGNGIPAANIPHIFSLFREAPATPMRETSTGFGLNIVKLIVEEQGGQISVQSTPGEGSTFYFLWKK